MRSVLKNKKAEIMGMNDIFIYILGGILIVLVVLLIFGEDWGGVIRGFLPGFNSSSDTRYDEITGEDELVEGGVKLVGGFQRIVKPGEEDFVDLADWKGNYYVSKNACYASLSKKYCIIDNSSGASKPMDYYLITSNFIFKKSYVLYEHSNWGKDNVICNIRIGEYTSIANCPNIFTGHSEIDFFVLNDAGMFNFQKREPVESLPEKKPGSLIITS